MDIPDPKAFPEDRVLVLNYRMKPAKWESGQVSSFYFRPPHLRSRYGAGTYEVPGGWSYSVAIDRPVKEDSYGRRRGGGYVIQVGDEDLSVAAMNRDSLRKGGDDGRS